MLRLREFWRLRKRAIRVTIATLAIVLSTAGALLLLGIGIMRAPVPFFHITDVPIAAGHITGVGVDLDAIPSANLLVDASFEPLVFHRRFTAIDGAADRLTVAVDEDGSEALDHTFFIGADIRVMSMTDREMMLRKNAKVADYVVNRLGSLQEVYLPADVPAALQLFAFARTEQVMIGVGERGTVLVGVDSHAPVSVKTGVASDLTGVCAAPDGMYLACARDGEVTASTDGVSWHLWREGTGVPLNAVAAGAFQYVAVGRGTVLAGTDGNLRAVAVPLEANWRDVAYGNDCFLACGDNGALIRSRNGVVWTPLARDRNTNWACVDYMDGVFAVAGSGATLWFVPEDGHPSKYTVPGAADLVDLAFISRQRLVVLDLEGRIFATGDGGETWTQTDLAVPWQPQQLAATTQGRILLAGTDGSLCITQLVNELILDAPLVEGVFQAGDLVFLEKVAQEIPVATGSANNQPTAEPWTVSHPGAATRILNDAAPGGGSGSIRLHLGVAEHAAGQSAYLSQVLVADADPNRFVQGRLYTASFWLRQEGLASREVWVWLTGRFDPVGAVVENIGAGWKRYEYTFVLPESATVGTPGELAFQIGIRDPGTVWLDALWLGPVTADAASLDTDFVTTLQAGWPDVLRMSFLGIGTTGVRKGNWAQRLGNESIRYVDNSRTHMSCGSLDTALRLANQSGALPWLTIAPYASDAEIRDLIEYLAGPITEPFGKLRMENGSAQPWTDVFNRVYIEIVDPENVLAGDLRKASFVNHVIGLIQQSSYYPFVRHQLAFVDGMPYETALMLSTADYHAEPLAIDLDAGLAIDQIHAAYRAFADRAPRMPDRPSDINFELISRLVLHVAETDKPAFAKWVEALAFGASDGYGVQLFGATTTPSQLAPQQSWSPACAVASRYIGGTALTVERLEAAPAHVTAYAFRAGDAVRVILINHATQAYTFPLESALRFDGARVKVFDADGRQISSEKLRRTASPADVLPGGVTIVEIEEVAQPK